MVLVRCTLNVPRVDCCCKYGKHCKLTTFGLMQIKLDVRDASGVIVDSLVVPRKQQDVYGANADNSDPVQFEYKIAQSSSPPGNRASHSFCITYTT